MVINSDAAHSVSQAIDLSIFRCPDCGGGLNSLMVCDQCARRFFRQDNYLELLPLELAEVKRGEDTVFAADSAELRKFETRIWRKIVGRLEVERFDKEIIPILPEGRFLELAGESCWVSAIYKSVYPNSTVFATDVAPSSIRHVAIPVCRMFPHQPDVFAAVDAEKLPFEDETFDCVFIESAMHHLPDLSQMLREVRRVLRPGGRFVPVDHVVPPHFRFLFQGTADYRSQEFGIQEELLSYRQWEMHFSAAGYPLDCLHAYTNTSYIRNPLFALAGRAASVLPDSLNRRLFPVGLFVCYDKPG